MRKRLPTAAVLLALVVLLAAAASASAAPEWHNGVTLQSTLYNPCLDISEFGAIAQTGYSSDPAVTHAGDVFYGHALFGAATYVGGNCTTTDQTAELDLSPPPGVSLAVDSAHPIYCFYQDGSGPAQSDPNCPTHTVAGTYGPQLPHGDGGGPWDMPPGRTIEVQFPLVSNRALNGPAGGHCPEDLGELSLGQPRDCLITPIHVADGTSDPWLLPNEEMILAGPPAGTTPSGGPGGGSHGGGSGSSAKASLKVAKHVRLGTLLAKGLHVVLTVPAAGSTAIVSLKQGHRTLAHARKRHLKAGRVTIRLRLSKAARRHLRHAKHAKLRLIEKLSSPKLTLQRTIVAKR